MSPRGRKRPRGVVDTSVLIAGAAALRGSPLEPETDSGKFLVRWIEQENFEWLYTEEILDEYKELLKRFNVNPSLAGRFVNLLREVGVHVRVRSQRSFSPDPGDDPFCACAEAGKASFIVTLNTRDFPQRKLTSKVIRPGDSLPLSSASRRRTKN